MTQRFRYGRPYACRMTSHSAAAASETTFDVIAEGYAYLEGPRWHDGRLWFSDFYTHRVVSCDEAGGNPRVEAWVPHQPSGLGWLPDGRLLIVSMRDHTLLRREPDGELIVHADLTGLAAGVLNDMVVDDLGRAYVGNFGFDLMGGDHLAPAPLIRVDPDGAVSVATEPLHFPNGAVIHDGVLIIGETFGNCITAFDISADGTLSEPRDWARFGPLPESTDVAEALGGLALASDGLCRDSENALWVADALAQRVVRVVEGGHITHTLHPGTGVYAVALGGSDGKTLFMCTAPSFDENERRDTRDARIVTTRVDVPA
ncbi:SMP-30/gluconolactonase/LRE family protein [Mycobacterium sp. Root135]|uniref:SMP-30/gluconolactonase/LRE family protein n=1 Tax=Mycobacterium sp. Root135 TaxID=1736457 RepID=UPI003515E8CF